MRILFLLLLLLPGSTAFCQPLPRPTPQQARWQELEFYLFLHFGPNTFTNKEWGEGNEPEDIFMPTALDCEQWCRIAKQSGAKGLIITAKHHDGFCLWPSQYSQHTVRESKWKNGQGDVLRELSAACKKYGLLFGVYISPWDRNHPQYGTPAYNNVYVNTMKEVVRHYGPIFEMWWDGANGEGPNGKKQVYDFRLFEKTIRAIAPNAVVFSDIGPDIRWVGNEKGFVGATNWNTLDTAGFARGYGAPHIDTLNQGNMNGRHWIPGECDVSIRPGWFYHAEEDTLVKTPEQLMQLYLQSVGRGANLLLNVPPDRRGLIHPNDSAALVGFARLRQQAFARNWLAGLPAQVTDGDDRTVTTKAVTDGRQNTFVRWKNATSSHKLEIILPKPVPANYIVLREQLRDGQKIKKCQLALESADETNTVFNLTTIGRKRILQLPTQRYIKRITFYLFDTFNDPQLSEIELY